MITPAEEKRVFTLSRKVYYKRPFYTRMAAFKGSPVYLKKKMTKQAKNWHF